MGKKEKGIPAKSDLIQIAVGALLSENNFSTFIHILSI
jgi:hypothetical protein